MGNMNDSLEEIQKLNQWEPNPHHPSWTLKSRPLPNCHHWNKHIRMIREKEKK